MNISATLNGEAVTITSINGNGSDVYISYVTAGGDLNYTKKVVPMGDEVITLATGATVN